MLASTQTADNISLRIAGKLCAARVFAWAGQQDEAVALLEQLADERPGLPPADVVLKPLYAVPLQDNPRFRALATRLEARMAELARIAVR